MCGDDRDLASLGSEEKNAVVEFFKLLARWNTEALERRRHSYQKAGASAVSVLGEDDDEG